jgi:hypothetical protein
MLKIIPLKDLNKLKLFKYSKNKLGGLFRSSFLYPLLFAIFPILALWETNFSNMGSLDAIHALLVTIIAAIVLYFILKLITRNSIKAGLISTLILLLYFTYGQILLVIKGAPEWGPKIARHRFMLPLWAAILAIGVFLILKYWRKLTGLVLYLNLIGLFLLASSGLQIGLAINREQATGVAQNPILNEADPAFNAQQAGNKADFPDIYLIVIDSYSRDDIILNKFHYDNSPFSQALTNMNFVVPRCSMSNYAFTAFSMSSMLNMNYLEAFYPGRSPTTTSFDSSAFDVYIRNSLVRNNLTELGYKTISFETDYPWVEIPDADIYYRSISFRSIMGDILTPSDFDTQLNETTMISSLSDASIVSPKVRKYLSTLQKSENNLVQKVFTLFNIQIKNKKYFRILDSLDKLENLAEIPGPKFVYLHSAGLHGDYVLGPNGEYQPTDDDIPGYENSLIYMDKRMLQIIPRLINNSRIPPIIILQGDHGAPPVTNSRLSNYQALYMPGKGKEVIYPSLTPVNTFRLIFNTYFNAHYPLLKDISYTRNGNRKDDFSLVPPSCPK